VGDHTRAIKKSASTKKGGIMQFAVKRRKCLFQGCNVPLAAGERTVCGTHKSQEAEAYRQRLQVVTSKERKFAQLWTTCQRCQGSLHQDVICSNRDCPIFYMRTKVAKELDEAADKL